MQINLRALSLVATVAVSLSLASCGGESKKEGEASEQTEPEAEGKESMESEAEAEEMAYDPTVDPAAKVEEVRLEANGNSMAEMKYSKTEIKVKAGSTVRLTFVNNAKPDMGLPHNFVLVKKGTMESVATKGITKNDNANVDPEDKDVLFHTEMVKEGGKIEVSFRAPAPGVYNYVCTTPGHWNKMNGVFIVE